MKSFKDLYIWSESMDLAVAIVRLTASFPWPQRRVLTGQMQRAALSVPSNIAEGKGRLSDRDFRRCLGIARGSLYELQTHLEVAKRLELIEPRGQLEIARQVNHVGAGINRLIDHIGVR